jgi:hypothetical protein
MKEADIISKMARKIVITTDARNTVHLQMNCSKEDLLSIIRIRAEYLTIHSVDHPA